MPLSVIDYLALGGALNVAVFYDLLFLIVLFAACERDLELDEPTFEVHLDGDYGKAFFGGFACETFQLCFVQQQSAVAARIGRERADFGIRRYLTVFKFEVSVVDMAKTLSQ